MLKLASLIFIATTVLSPLTYANQCHSLLGAPQIHNQKQSFIAQYAEKVFRTIEQNSAWIRKAFSSKAKGLYIEITASELKAMNDSIIKDKDLVTAIVNFNKLVNFDFLSSLEKQNDDSESYSDFKTIRFFLPVTQKAEQAELAKEIQDEFIKIDEAFNKKLIEKGILKGSDLKTQFFHIGIATTADLSSLAARKAKQKKQKSYLLFKENFSEIEKDRTDIINSFKEIQNDSKMNFAFENNKMRLKVIELFRKNKEPHLFREAIRENLHMNISENQALKITDLLEKVDTYSPSLLISERTSVAIDSAPFGAYSIDFVGLGAKNLLSTLAGVLESSSALDLTQKIREKEQEITEDFQDQKQMITDVVDQFFRKKSSPKERAAYKEQFADIRFSGDEGIIVPPIEMTLSESLELQKLLFGVFNYSGLRMTFLHPNANNKIDTNVVSTAENIEKALRKRAVGIIGLEILEQMQFNIFVPTSKGEPKTAYLNIYTPVALTDAQILYVKTHFKDLVLEANQNKKEAQAELIPGVDVFGLVGPQ